MECIYIQDIDPYATSIIIPTEEACHLKSLRINTGGTIMATNGRGLMCELRISRDSKTAYSASINKVYNDYGEDTISISLAIGLLSDNTRFEFALEKAIELGIDDFYPLMLDFSQKSWLNEQRLKTKAISSIKQCKRSILPNIHKLQSLLELSQNFGQYDSIIIADPSGKPPSDEDIGNRTIIIIGAEGGFSPSEIALLKSHNIIKWDLGSRRLRAETAAISALSYISLGSNRGE